MKTNRILISAFILGAGIFTFNACSSDDDGDSLPPIGGFNNSNEVGQADLLAHWPLDGNGNERLSGTAPSNTVNVTWIDTDRGQGAKMNAGFLDYPSIDAISNNTTGNYSISAWAKVSNTKLVPDGPSHISPIISFTGGLNQNVGNLALFGNTHGLTTSDSIQMKAEFHFKRTPEDGTDFGGDAINMIKMEPWMITDNENGHNHTAAANKIGGQWAHVVYVYDGVTANNRLYVNGVKISNSEWESRNGGNPMPMKFFTPSHPVIGALWSVANGTNVDTWNAALSGEVDEIRVWKKVLSQAEINALYQLESQGR